MGVLESLGDEDINGLERLREAGARLALDRFGSGAFSLAQLQRLQVDELKLDADLLRVLDKPSVALALGILDLARRMGLTCVACGLADNLQYHFLKRYKWGQAQGPIFAAPATGIEFALRSLNRAARNGALP